MSNPINHVIVAETIKSSYLLGEDDNSIQEYGEDVIKCNSSQENFTTGYTQTLKPNQPKEKKLTFKYCPYCGEALDLNPLYLHKN